MAYELLTGQSPFHGRTPARMLAAHMTETPAPVSQLRPDVPAALEQLVMRCLEKEPSARPQSAGEIVQALDSITSGSLASMPAALMAGPGALKRTLAIYAVAFVAVAILARAAIVAFALPDWVFPGALIVMLLGLPVLLFTWYVSRTMRRLATLTPQLTPGGTAAVPGGGTMANLAVKASPHVSWRRAWIGGAFALGSFAAIVAAFMVLRAMGIGPAGSLLAAGKMGERERLIVTDFQAPDSSLAALVNEAVRTNLGQSRVISIMPPIAIGGALQRMQRPATSRLDLALAREIAEREGVKVIVDGTIRTLGGGYIVSLRLVSADSASVLAAYQETADGPRELLETIDKITRKLRGKIGESLREVRGNPPLEQVTTPSLEALRKYAEAQRQIDLIGDPLKASDLLREAVKIDTAFAMAWRKLGVALNNAGRPRASIDSALGKAYQFRERLTERERLLAEATYFHLGPGRDRRKAIDAYRQILELDPTETAAANNLGNIYSGRRDFARAESLYKRVIAAGRASQQQYTNLVAVLYNQGKLDEAEKLLAEIRQRFPTVQAGTTGLASFYYQRGQLDSMETLYKQVAKGDNIISRIQGNAGMINYSLLRGRIADAYRYIAETQKLQATLGQPSDPVQDSLARSWADLWYADDSSRAVRRMDATLAKTNLASRPFDQRAYLTLTTFYALAGQPQKARGYLARYESEVPKDSASQRLRFNDTRGALGAIALAEGRPRDAIREFWAADTTYDGPDGNCAICIMDDVGAAWRAAGEPDSALYYWEKYLSTPYYGREGMDGTQAALIHRWAGELYEAKGDIPNAVRHYREFVKRWDRADPMLQPKVAEVKRRLSRMADTEKKG